MVATVAVFLDEIRLPHFGKGFLRGDATIFGAHGTEFVNFEATIITGEARLGINGGGVGVGDFLGEIDEGHRNGSNNEGNRAKDKVSATFDEASATGKRRDGDENGRGAADGSSSPICEERSAEDGT